VVNFVNSLQLGELLGEGAFGKVYKGFALGIDGRMEPAVVAVKMLKGIIAVMAFNYLISVSTFKLLSKCYMQLLYINIDN